MSAKKLNAFWRCTALRKANAAPLAWNWTTPTAASSDCRCPSGASLGGLQQGSSGAAPFVRVADPPPRAGLMGEEPRLDRGATQVWLGADARRRGGAISLASRSSGLVLERMAAQRSRAVMRRCLKDPVPLPLGGIRRALLA
ncbi:MAG: hypothetical protein VKO39_08425 [Cyanobacteriota bacterium]|nr:hypothetical protein [Cyanobacteriota bacterium]